MSVISTQEALVEFCEVETLADILPGVLRRRGIDSPLVAEQFPQPTVIAHGGRLDRGGSAVAVTPLAARRMEFSDSAARGAARSTGSSS